MTGKRITLLCVACLVASYVGVGIAWTWLDLGELPRYGDTGEYIELSQTLEVDQYRGILYPALLAGATRWWGSFEPDREPRVLGVQLLQLGACLLSLAYFLSVFAGTGSLRAGRGRRLATGVLFLLLFFDPLLAHFDLSIMPDALALSGSLLFCAALGDLGVRRSAPALSATLLLLGMLLAAGLRAEKSAVMLATGLVTAAVWLATSRRHAALAPGLRRRAAAVLVVVSLGFGAMTLVQRAFYQPSDRWPAWVNIVHQRIIFPNLHRVYADLPPEARQRIRPLDAVLYDMRIHNTWKVINRVTGDDPEVRDRLTRQLIGPVLEKRWAAIAGSTLLGTLENVLAPFSFYARLAPWLWGGEKESAFRIHFEATPWTYYKLAQPHPRLSRLFVLLAGAVFVVAVVLSLLQLRAAVAEGGWRLRPRTLVLLAPVAAFCAINALAFSLVAALVHIRYAIFAHAAVLLLVYTGAIRWLLGGPPRAREPAAGRRAPAYVQPAADPVIRATSASFTTRVAIFGWREARTQRKHMVPSRCAAVSIQFGTPGSSWATTMVTPPSGRQMAVCLFRWMRW
jgi:hypothetical protein